MSRARLASLFAAVAAVLLPCAAGAQGMPSAAELSQKLPFDPLVKIGTLDNGLKYYIMPNKYPEKRAELRLAVRVGSIVEADDQRGLAHMTEHMAFNGTQHFPKNDLVHYLQSIGMRFGADVNAYTSFDETVYQLQMPTDTLAILNKGFQILADWAHSLTFDSAEVDGERGVVLEEWRLGRGAGARMQDQQFPVLLKGSRYAERLPIGNADGLKTFQQAALRRFYQQWYRPDLMAVVAVGDFDKDQVEQMIRQQFGSIPKPTTPTVRPGYPVPPHDTTYVTIATDREATNSSFNVYSILPRRDMTTVGSFRTRYVERIGLNMLNARYAEIGQKPNPPFAAAGAGRGYFIQSADAYTLFGGVKEGGVLAGYEGVMTEVERASRFGFTQSELDRTKASYLRSQDQSYAQREKQPSQSHAEELLRNFLQDEDVVGVVGEHEMYQRITPTITLDEVNRAMRDMLAGRNQVIMVNAPEKAGSTLPTAAQLLAMSRAVKTKALEPYKDVVVTAPLLARIPAPAAIVSERKIPEIGVTELTLANGVIVVLKPTDFVADQVFLTGTSPGGTSLVPDSLYASASLGMAAVSGGGLGEFNAIDLRKVLTGKIASASATVAERTENISGSASPKDLETMFQLVYLRFTAPRKDTSAWLATKQMLQAQLANIGASPQGTWLDTIQGTVGQHNIRRQPLSVPMLDQVNLDRAMAIYRDRFSDASDFTFTMVGNFNVDSVKPLLQRYLGGLPATHRKEAAKDLGIRPPAGVVEKTVRKGVEPQSQTYMSFTTPFQYSAVNQYTLSSLGEILTNRLLDHLREKLGGTYSIGAQAAGTRESPNIASVTVSFGSAPERADELTKAVLADLKAIQDSGPTVAELEKVQEAQRRARETSLKVNSFWATQLSSAWRFGDDPRDVLAYDKLVNGLTAAAIRDAARRYIDMTNYIHITLLPESKTP